MVKSRSFVGPIYGPGIPTPMKNTRLEMPGVGVGGSFARVARENIHCDLVRQRRQDLVDGGSWGGGGGWSPHVSWGEDIGNQ